MARIIGEIPEEMFPAEEIMYNFVRTELPDYILASMYADIRVNNTILDFDMLLFVPHMGAFILEIRGATGFIYKDGNFAYLNKNGQPSMSSAERMAKQPRNQRYILRDYLKRRFGIT